ncbi:MAG: DinB family protein [Bacteroidetes bacterium]|nr:DinB family protein [Bacteroidota bacterium]
MKLILAITLVFGLFSLGKAQTKPEEPSKAPVWTEADRKYLVENLIRSKEEILAETKNLTKEQWNFKESPDRWSINQIVEHLCLWEIITMNDVSSALRMGPLAEFTHYLPDSLFIDKDPKRLEKNLTTEFTKPFTYGVPLGNNDGKNNIIWYTTLTNESIDYLKSTRDNIRIHYICFGPNIHQRYMMFFQHCFRHLGQIREVKKHPKYPK